MTKPLRCRVGWHAWHLTKDTSEEAPELHLLECSRCDARDDRPTNVAIRLGWPAHTNS